MTTMQFPKDKTMRASSIRRALAMGFLGMLVSAQAAQTDISSTPFSATVAAQAKPNIMLLMDTSGSMGWGHMPDEVETVLGTGSIGYKSAACNVVYYNPAILYVPPKQSDGTSFPTPSFNAAPYDAYATTTTTVDLAHAFQAYDNNTLQYNNPLHPTLVSDTPQAAYYYLHTGGTNITAYNSPACPDADNGATQPASDGGTWTRVSPTSSAADQQNFTIWYSYYRTRILLVKTAASLAFTPLTDSFRVGFITMKPKDTPSSPAINPAAYLAINDFDSTQRSLWFNKLFSQTPKGSSPAREGLARVGRHYAGMHDGINAGMTGDPVQYYCQQNFTIMTTDGYWNAQDESTPAGAYLGGPVDKTGMHLVGDQDANRTPPSGDTPRPIWEGQPDGSQTTTDNRLQFSTTPCGTYFSQSTLQLNQSTTQVTSQTTQTQQTTTQNLQGTSQTFQTSTQATQSTSQTEQQTTQNLQSTNQNRQNVVQNTQSTVQITQSTVQYQQATTQNLQNTVQNLQSTSGNAETDSTFLQTVTIALQSTAQNLQSTYQNLQSTTQTLIGTTQQFQSTVQNLSSTVQNLQSTTQTQQQTVQNLQSTNQNLQSTSQTTQSSSQATQSTSQSFTSTYQVNQATAQINITTSRVRETTSQQFACDKFTELCSPSSASTCNSGSNFCQTQNRGPTLVASCTPASPSAANDYTTVTCTSTGSGPTPTASCTPQTAAPGNNYLTITCNTVTNGPTPTPVSSCNAAPASSSNAYTATTCTPVSTGPTASSCTPIPASAPDWTATTCSYVTTGPTGVTSCTPSLGTSANSWTTTTCGTNASTNVPVSSCTPVSPSSANGYATVTCNTVTTTDVPVQTCSPASPTSSNNWTTVTCGVNASSSVPVTSCTPSPATLANNWTATTCPTPNTTPWVGVSSCTPVLANSGNNYTATTCRNNNTTNVPVASCSPSSANSGNSYTDTTCPAPATTSNVPVASCTPASASSSNAYTATTCSNNNTSNVAVASCTPGSATSGNAYTTTTCAPVTTGPTGVSSCTPIAATSANNYTATTCTPNNSTNVPVASCTPDSPTAANGYTTTTCPTPVSTTDVPVASCTSDPTPNAGNSYTATTCSQNNTSNVPVASCTASLGSPGNGYTVTTCPAPTVVSGPTAVASCTPDAPTAANGYQQTTCTTTSHTFGVGTCVPQSPNAGNGYVTVTCNTFTADSVPVASCTPQSPNAGNGYVTTTCPPPNVTTNVPVDTCTATPASSTNAWTTSSCPPPATTGPTAVASCTPSASSMANSYVTTTCPAPVTTGPTGVASCTPIAASSANNYVATTCGNGNSSNVPVQTCNPQIGDGTNGWLTISCGNNNSNNTPVATCTPQTGSSANNWITITCAPPVTVTDVPVPTCTPVALATSANNYTTTTCSTNNPPAVASGSCVPDAPTSSNGWVTTTCPTVVGGPTAVSSCTPATGDGTNSWTTITCGNNNVASTPVSSCTPVSPTSANGYLTVSCNTVTTADVPVQTCSPSLPTSANGYQTTTCTPNNTNVPSGTCVASPPTSANGWTTTTCPAVTSPVTGVSSCTPSGPSAPNWTTTTCPSNVATGPTPVASCTPSNATAGNSWVTTTCAPVSTGPSVVTTCNPAPPSAANNYTATICTQLAANQIQHVLTTTVSTSIVSGGNLVGTPVVTTTVGTPTNDGVCIPPPLPVVLPSSNPMEAGTALTGTLAGLPPIGPLPPSGCNAWPCTTSTNFTGPKSVNSLADVAQYYYVTDLRTAADWPPSPPTDVSTDGVPSVGSGPEDDRRPWQHMTTFSIALGVSGTLQYQSDYKTAATGDFSDIRCAPPHQADESDCKNWPLWPDPSLDYAGNANLYSDPRSIDDFWHAAVNGRGQFFSAADPRSVIAGLAGALAGINSKTASGSGPGTSTLNPVPGNNSVYLASYRTQFWDGDVQAYSINVATGDIDTSTAIWSAGVKLDALTSQLCDNRHIYLIRTNGTKPNNLANFTLGTSSCDSTGAPAAALPDDLNTAELANFDSLNVSLLSQYPSMTDGTFGTVDQRSEAVGSNLVNFLRGQHGREGFQPNTDEKLYRTRANVLGDIVGGEPVYVQAPFAAYNDVGYQSFKTANSARTAMLYVAGNDGMLHAFYANTDLTDPNAGKEAWAVIPSAMLPSLYQLADNNYGNVHRFYVDAAPVISDVQISSTWTTLLVGGFNAGGKGFYALDVTNPTAPKALWEFKPKASACSNSLASPTASAGQLGDCNVGYSFGQPVITKLKDGRWVVMVTSGYNNVNGASNGGDGMGFLYVLNAADGTVIYKITTGVGDSVTPSGLAQINNYADSVTTDNTSLRVYGTDLFGDIWRFDVNDTILPAGIEAKLLAQAKDAGGVPQPITTKPELGLNGGNAMVFVGTGRLLGASDLADTQVQSIYGIVDPLSGTTSPSYTDMRTSLSPLAFSLTGTTRTIACTGNATQCGASNGWYVDLLPGCAVNAANCPSDAGERVNVNMNLSAGTLVVASNVPSTNACVAGGTSWLTQLDFRSGLVVSGSATTAVSQNFSQGLIVGFAVVKLQIGSTQSLQGLLRFSNGTGATVPIGSSSAPPTKRVSWREVVAP